MITTLILGASLKPERYSNMAMRRLVSHNFWVVGIGKQEGEIDGSKIYKEHIFLENLHTVSIYLNTHNQKNYYDYVLNLEPKRVIFNPGSENIEFENLLTRNQISFEHSCTLVLLHTNQY